MNELHIAHIFFKLNLWLNYHQIGVYVEDVHKTNIGHYKFLLMPFWLSNTINISIDDEQYFYDLKKRTKKRKVKYDHLVLTTIRIHARFYKFLLGISVWVDIERTSSQYFLA